MNNIIKFLEFVQNNSVQTPENLPLIKKYLKNSSRISFFSWKLFKISLQPLTFDLRFDENEANLYIKKESDFINCLSNCGICFDYLKIIPDDLTSVFWNKKLNILNYKAQLKIYYEKIYPNTQILSFLEILRQNNLDQFYKNILNISKSIDPSQYEVEINSRSNMYTSIPLNKTYSVRLAKKAFDLFAAEAAVLYKLQSSNIFPNLVLLAGSRSINTYKYEFIKYPKNRPILPKLFVL